MPFTAGAGGTLKGMDFLGNPLTWHSANGVVTLHVGDGPIYVFDVPANFALKQTLKITGFPQQVRPNQRVEAQLQVANTQAMALHATLSASSGSGVVTAAPNVDVPAGATTRIPIQFQADATSSGNQSVTFTLKSGDQTLSLLDLPYYAVGPAISIPQVAEAPALDGSDSTWSSANMESADTANNVVIGRPDVGVADPRKWQGPSDCSFTVKTEWRPGDGIYVRVDVTDDKLFPTPADRADPWLWDGLELFVDTRAAASRTAGYGVGAQQIMVVPAVGNVSAPCRVMALSKQPTVDATFTGQATAHGYLLEGKITPRPGSGFTLGPGSRLAMDFSVDDNDGDGRKAQLALHGGATNSLDTSGWGTYELHP
jgi:hypothetical protein